MPLPSQDFDIAQPEILKALKIIRAGGVVAYPTESFYGLGADPQNEPALQRIYEIKGRKRQNPILILVGSMADVMKYARNITIIAQRLMEKFWPGPLTIVFDAAPTLSPLIHAGTRKVGLRLSSHPLATFLAGSISGITGTSANQSGRPAHMDARGVRAELGGLLDLVLEWPMPCAGIPSTVVDASGGSVRIIREGQISKAKVFEVIEKKSFDSPPSFL